MFSIYTGARPHYYDTTTIQTQLLVILPQQQQQSQQLLGGEFEEEPPEESGSPEEHGVQMAVLQLTSAIAVDVLSEDVGLSKAKYLCHEYKMYTET